MRQGCRHGERAFCRRERPLLACALGALVAVMLAGSAPRVEAQSPAAPTASAAPTAPAGPPPYWQAPALPSAVIPGGAIPSGWTPQPVPYQGIGPDGKPFTRYFAPTYTFTYPVGPPVPAIPRATAVPVNRKQAPGYVPPAGMAPGWTFQSQGVPPPTYALPPATTARYTPQAWQYPPGAPQLGGTAISPPPAAQQLAPPPSYQPPPAYQAPSGFQSQPPGFPSGQPLAPPPSQWVPAPTSDAAGFGAAAAAVAPPAIAAAAASQQGASSLAAASPAAPVPVQPTSSVPLQSPANRAANTHLWRVVGVYDGDTVTCLDENNQQQKIRLAEMDAPEMGQDFGQVSRDALADLVFGKTVEVRDEGKDRYGRWIAHLFINGIDVNRQMIATGNAWHYAAYSKDASLATAQEQAKAQRLGLWAQPNPMPPWEFRATERSRKATAT
ncbi:MAG: thermonuclease family protein [Planctomycetota bacterium]|nr:thermonuclease family protein [Planctomycetota bacterium]